MTLLLALLWSQDVQVEIEARLAWTAPKFRVRDGESWLAPSSVFSRELDAESSRFSPGGALRAAVGSERFSLGFWGLRTDGDGVLDEPKSFGGVVVPAGTEADADVRFHHMELGWSHRFTLWVAAEGEPSLSLDAGLAVEWLVFDADLGFGGTRLDGVFPTPQLMLDFRPSPFLGMEAGVGGFFIPFANGDTDILDPIQYRFGISARWNGWTLRLGFELYHVHLEENADDPDEDIVHLRLRSFCLSLSLPL